MKFGAPSPKRLMLRSNWKDIQKMDLGRLARAQAAAQTTVKTSRLCPNCIVLQVNIMHACMYKVGKANSGVAQRLWRPHSNYLRLHARMHAHAFWSSNCMHMKSCLRVYPPAFGRRLLQTWVDSDLGDVPLRSLRPRILLNALYIYICHAMHVNTHAGSCTHAGGSQPQTRA